MGRAISRLGTISFLTTANAVSSAERHAWSSNRFSNRCRALPLHVPCMRRPSVMPRHKQVTAEIDMHAEVLPALGQRLDLVLHRVDQR